MWHSVEDFDINFLKTKFVYWKKKQPWSWSVLKPAHQKCRNEYGFFIRKYCAYCCVDVHATFRCFHLNKKKHSIYTHTHNETRNGKDVRIIFWRNRLIRIIWLRCWITFSNIELFMGNFIQIKKHVCLEISAV